MGDGSGGSGELVRTESDDGRVFEKALRDLQQRSPLKVLRVTQLDAEQLDAELGSMFRTEVDTVFKWWRPWWFDQFKDELHAGLNLAMCALSLWQDSATHGLALMSLKYRDERRHGRNAVGSDAPITRTQKILWTAGHVLIPYAWARLSRIASDRDWNDPENTSRIARIWRAFSRLESAFVVASLINTLVFLWNGKYRSLLDRLLCMRLVYSRRHMNRQVSFEFLHRQLVWQAFTEVVLFIMPLFRLSWIKSLITRQWSRVRPSEESEQQCPYCQTSSILIPVRLDPCGHRACYYCAASQLRAAQVNSIPAYCAQCSEKVTAIVRLTV